MKVIENSWMIILENTLSKTLKLNEFVQLQCICTFFMQKVKWFSVFTFFFHQFHQLIVFSLFHSTAISLSNYSGRLKHLDISSCHQITDNSLSALRLVTTLILFMQGTCNSLVKERSMCCFVTQWWWWLWWWRWQLYK